MPPEIETGRATVVRGKPDLDLSAAARPLATRPATLVCAIAPGPPGGEGVLARHMLAALGKDTDVRRLAAGNTEASRIARVWLRAEGIRTALVLGAEYLDAGAWSKAAELARAEGQTVVLLHERAALARGHRERLASDEQLGIASAQEFCTWAAAERFGGTATRSDPEPGADRFPQLPEDEIPFFRGACWRSLSGADFERVEQTLGVGIQATSRWIARVDGISEQSVRAFLGDLLDRSDDVNEQLALVRAVQAALWRAGWLLKMPVPAAGRGDDRRRPSPLAARNLLRNCAQPRLAALAALAFAARLRPSELATLDADQIAIDGELASLRLEGGEVEIGELSPLVKAIVVERELLGLPRHGPLFMTSTDERLKPRAIQRLLRGIARESGLPLLRGGLVGRGFPESVSRTGLSLQAL